MGKGAGADPGEVKWVNFHPPFSEPPSSSFFCYASDIEIIFDFSDIITKIHPPFQNPESALEELYWGGNRVCTVVEEGLYRGQKRLICVLRW